MMTSPNPLDMQRSANNRPYPTLDQRPPDE